MRRRRPNGLFMAIVMTSFLGVLAVTASWPFGQPRQLDRILETFAEQRGLHGGVFAYGTPGEPPAVDVLGRTGREGRSFIAEDTFKIASLSKPLTARAILALLQKEGLTLDTPLVELLPVARQAVDARSEVITIRHLLQHSAGWDQSMSFDPFFADKALLETSIGLAPNPIATCSELADAMMSLPLQFEPGTRYAYSNLGYCWLGRILAQYGQGSYERAVRHLVPELDSFSLQETDLTIHPEVSNREASYLVNSPNAISAAGGWITDARSYFSFAERHVPQEIIEQPIFVSQGRGYGLGWGLRNKAGSIFLCHFGSMPGTFSLVIRKLDGPMIVALFDGRPRDPQQAFDQLFEAITDLPSWRA